MIGTKRGARRKVQPSNRPSRRVLGLAVVMVAALMLALMGPASAATKSPPGSFKAKSKTNTEITFSWSRISGVNRYAIQYSTSSSFSNPKYGIADGITTNAQALKTIRGFAPASSYYFRILGTTSSGSNVSGWSKAIKVTTGTYRTAAPSKPAASNVLSTSMRLKWSETENAGKYRVRYSTSSTFASNVQYAYPVDPMVDLTGLQKNTKYYIQVRALEAKADENFDPYLMSGYSSSATVTTHPNWTQLPATGLEVLQTSASGIVLQWDEVQDADFYRIQQWADGSTAKSYLNTDDARFAGKYTIQRAGGKVTATIKQICNSDTGACVAPTAGKTYNFRLSSYSGASTGGAVNISDYTPTAVKALATSLALPWPTDQRLDAVSSNSITLSWKSVPGATSYRLQTFKTGDKSARYFYDCKATSTPACTTSGGRVSVTLTKFESNSVNLAEVIKPNTVYSFRVVSQLPNGQAGTLPDSYAQFDDRASEYPTDQVKATTALYGLDAPTLSKTNASNSSVTLAYPRVSTTTGYGYQIQMALDTTFTSVKKTVCLVDPLTGPDTLTQTVTGLVRNTSYFFRVQVVDDCTTPSARSGWSTPIVGRTADGVGAISGQVTDEGRLGGNLSDALSTMVASAYRYDDSDTNSDDNLARTTRVGANGSYTLDGLEPGKYRVLVSQIGYDNAYGATTKVLKNYTSAWVATDSASTPACSTWTSECHKLGAKAKIFTVGTSATPVTVDVAKIGPGLVLRGKVSGKTAGIVITDAGVDVVSAPVENADVTREFYEGTTSLKASAGGASIGDYIVQGLLPGKYKLTFNKPGYNSASLWINQVADEAAGGVNMQLCRTTGDTGCVPTPSDTYN